MFIAASTPGTFAALGALPACTRGRFVCGGAGALVGYLAWHPGATLLWLLALPALWARTRQRTGAYLAFFGYYLACARDVPASVLAFDGSGASVCVCTMGGSCCAVGAPVGYSVASANFFRGRRGAALSLLLGVHLVASVGAAELAQPLDRRGFPLAGLRLDRARPHGRVYDASRNVRAKGNRRCAFARLGVVRAVLDCAPIGSCNAA